MNKPTNIQINRERHGDSSEKYKEDNSYFRMFKIEATPFKPEAIECLAKAQKEIDPPDDRNSMKAGYTYLGQFIDHDITHMSGIDTPAEAGSSHTNGTIPSQECNASLDLDGLYGIGLDDENVQYNENGTFFSEHFDQAKGLIVDLPRGSSDNPHLAKIADRRNDENFIISRLHVLFMNAHNNLITKYDHNFEQARKRLTLMYQSIVMYDFLPKILHRDTHGLLKEIPEIQECRKSINYPEKQFIKVKPLLDVTRASTSRIPLEFSVAAFRFGHSLVRSSYFLSSLQQINFPLRNLFDLVGKGGLKTEVGNRSENRVTLKNSELEIDWNLFFGKRGNPARGIRTDVAESLESIIAARSEGKGLTLRNLERSSELGIPDAQSCIAYLLEHCDYAKKLGLELPREQSWIGRTFLDKTNIASNYQTLVDEVIAWEFHKKTPLWTYILMEAAGQGNKTLGLLGSIIVAEVFRSLFITSRTSIFRPDSTLPNFDLEKVEYRMSDLISLAEDNIN